MKTSRNSLSSKLGGKIISVLASVVLVVGLVPLPAFADAAQDGKAEGATGIATGAAQGAAQGSGQQDGGKGQPAAALLVSKPGGAPLRAQDEGNLYAVFDSEGGILTFKREAGTYTDGQEVGTKTYYTGVEDIEYAPNNRPSWLAKASDIKKVDFQAPVAPKSCVCWFDYCRNLEEVLNADRLDTSKVASMRFMFNGCQKLSSLDTSKWSTSKVVDMTSMFEGCSSLDKLDVSGWDTSKVTDMGGMFRSCSSLDKLDVSKWNTSEVTDMGGMFASCSSLASLDVSRWDTSKATDIAGMFASCSSLSSLDVSGWNTSEATGMGSMFYFCKSLASLDVSRWDTSKVESMASMFNNCSSLASLDVSGWDTSEAIMMIDMFRDCSTLDFLDLSGWDTSSAENMQNMFEGCSKLSSVKLGDGFSFKTRNPGHSAVLPNAPNSLGYNGEWINESEPGAHGVMPEALTVNYPNATNPSFAPGTYAWKGTTKVAVLDSEYGSLTFKREAGTYNDGDTDGTKTYYTGFENKDYSLSEQPSWFAKAADIKKVDFQATVAPISCAYWFSYCQNLEEVCGTERLITSAVTSMDDMFEGCKKIDSLDVSRWNTGKVESMYCMFIGCENLTTLDVSGWDTSQVTGMNGMFNFCYNLATLDVSGWDTSQVLGMTNMFEDCYNLATLDVSGWNTSQVRDMSNMFDDCYNLATLDVSRWDTSQVSGMMDMFRNCRSLASVKLGKAFSFKGGGGIPDWYAVLPDAPVGTAHTGKWINSSEPDAVGVTAADLRDSYPNASDPSLAPGTYVWEANIEIAIVAATDQVYDGTKKKPAPTVTWMEAILVEGTDYEVASYTNNKDAGTATVTVKGKGGYRGTVSGTFKIAPKPATIKVNGASKVWGQVDPAFTGTVEGLVAEGDLGKVTYFREGADEAPGTYKGVLDAEYTPNSNYAVTVSKGDFTISEIAIVSASAKNAVYSGKPLKPAVTVKDASGKTVAAANYTVSYSNNTNVGTATATVTAKKGSGYTGTVKTTFQIKSWKRLSGANTAGTMTAITKEFGKAGVAVVTTNAAGAKGIDAGYKDALASAALAGGFNAPLLTTAKGSLSPETRSELSRMGVKTVYLVGSTSEVSANAEKQIKAMGITVKRVSGKGKSASASAASLRAIECAKLVKGRSDTVIIATQANYRDALAIAPYAYASKSPILYAETSKVLSPEVISYIKSARFKRAIVVGGPIPLPDGIETQLKSAGIAAGSITRLAGSNYYKTARVVAEWACGKLANGTGGGSGFYQYASVKFQPAVKLSANKMGVARADNAEYGWKDGAIGAALCGKNRSVLLLADAANDSHAVAFVKANSTSVRQGYVFGGTAAVPKATYDRLVNASL